MFTQCKHDRSGAACLMQALTSEPVSVGALFTARALQRAQLFLCLQTASTAVLDLQAKFIVGKSDHRADSSTQNTCLRACVFV